VPAPPQPDTRQRPGRYRYDPLRRMMHRGSTRLRRDVAVEDALRHAAALTVVPPAVPPAALDSGAAAERALALKRAAPTVPPLPELAPVMLRRGACPPNRVPEPFGSVPAAAATHPRRTRAP
jgi:hypothetical protein